MLVPEADHHVGAQSLDDLHAGGPSSAYPEVRTSAFDHIKPPFQARPKWFDLHDELFNLRDTGAKRFQQLC
jgi:hypothetical protein